MFCVFVECCWFLIILLLLLFGTRAPSKPLRRCFAICQNLSSGLGKRHRRQSDTFVVVALGAHFGPFKSLAQIVQSSLVTSPLSCETLICFKLIPVFCNTRRDVLLSGPLARNRDLSECMCFAIRTRMTSFWYLLCLFRAPYTSASTSPKSHEIAEIEYGSVPDNAPNCLGRLPAQLPHLSHLAQASHFSTSRSTTFAPDGPGRLPAQIPHLSHPPQASYGNTELGMQ